LIVANGFLSAGIHQSIDAGTLILEDLEILETSNSEEDDFEDYFEDDLPSVILV
jgi:hypothetical protein